MNIIKFKDTFILDQDWYNEKLRGKYAYWVRCRYIVPLDAIPIELYMGFENSINDLLGYDYYVLTLINNEYVYELLNINDITENQMASAVLVDDVPEHPTSSSYHIIKIDNSIVRYIDLWDENFNWILNAIDSTETDKVNSVDFYKKYNEHIPTDDLTIEELKQFRTWLATTLITLREYSEDDLRVLNYYAGGMTDETTRSLTRFGGITTTINNPTTSNCGCVGGTNSDLSSLYNTSLSVCDPLSIYRANIKAAMIDLFSNIDFWNTLPTSFLEEVVNYINGIITADLPMIVSLDNIYNCNCLKDNNLAQSNAQLILRDLVSAFTYMINKDIDGHKNNITNTLINWSTNLYEKMQWV